MSYSLTFDSKLTEALKNHPKVSGYDWQAGCNIDDRSRVDVVGSKNGVPTILVEVELKKDNPVENVVKIWRWAKKNQPGHEVVLVQAFSGLYNDPKEEDADNAKRKQFERSVFIGQQMSEDPTVRIKYKHLPIYSTTRNGKSKLFMPLLRRGVVVKTGGTSMHRAAEELAKEIAELVS